LDLDIKVVDLKDLVGCQRAERSTLAERCNSRLLVGESQEKIGGQMKTAEDAEDAEVW
jgi:hypothetical protein